MDDVEFLFRGWDPVVRTMFVGVVGWLVLLVLVRLSGPRTLSQLTPFDAVVTVTVGSAFGRVLTAENVPVVEVVVTLTVLVALQWVGALLRDRVPGAKRLMRPRPALLFHRGSYLRGQMRRQHVTEEDLLTATRESGYGSLGEVEAVVLEPDGTFAVLGPAHLGDGSALAELADS